VGGDDLLTEILVPREESGVTQKTATGADAHCHQCGFTRSEDSRDICPLCLPRKQSLSRYGSNSISEPIKNRQGLPLVPIGLVVVVVALLWTAFSLAMRQENQRLERAVARIERASR
jgi:uncharacterized membrane protein YvbJ